MAATKKTTAAKPKSAAAKPAAAVAETAPPAPAGGAGEEAGPARVKAPSLRIKELVDRVAAATGGKKRAVKDTVEAALKELGEALSRGEELNLPGFGRTRIARSSEKDGASHLTLKVRRGPHKKRDGAAKDPLAEDGEDS